MKFFKISLYALGAIILLLVIAAGIFIATFDASQYRSLISEQVKQQTGRELLLGDIKPSVFPWLGVELRQISLSNANGFKADNMLTMQTLDVRLKLLPLLSQKIHVDTLKVHGLNLFLEKDKHGKTNWDDILEKQAQAAPNPSPQSATKTTASDTSAIDPLAGMVINGVELKAANIHWSDAGTAKNIALKNVNLISGAWRAGEALPLSFSTQVEVSEPAAQVALKIQTQLAFDIAAQQYKFTDFVLDIDARLQQSALTQIQLTLKSELELDLAQQRFQLPDFSMQINLHGEATSNKAVALLIEGGAVVDAQQQTAMLKPFQLATSALKINLEMAARHFIDAPEVSGKFEVENFNPHKLVDLFDIKLPKMRGKDALQNAALKFNFSANENALNVSALTLKLDKSVLSGKLNVKKFTNPEVNYTIKLDQLTLDDYLPPAPKLVANASNPSKHSPSPVTKPDALIELPVEMMRELNLNGVLQVASLKMSDQTLSSLHIKTVAKSGLIKIPELSVTALQGEITGSAIVDVRNNTPRYQIKLKGDRLKAESIINPILQDMLGEKSVAMSGETNVNLHLKTQGQTLAQLIAGSSGIVKLNMGKATLHGVDAEYFVRKAVVDFLEQKKQAVPQDWRGEYQPKDTTALKIARASAVIKKGVVENKNLLLKASRFSITGAGKINLPREKLDYRLVVDVSPSKTKTAGERLLDVPMPIFVKGDFAQPDISIDSKVWLKSVGKELKAEVKKEIKQKLEKQKRKKIDKLKDKYKDKWKKLFR